MASERPSEAVEAELQTEVEEEFEELDVDTPLVGIIMGSKNDMPTMEKAADELSERGIRSEIRVMSAHRDPDTVADYCRNAHMRGIRVIIAGAGLAAALPGVAAANTDLPVIGVPLTSRTSVAGGLDALLAIAQMPPGVPVACVGVDSARNAAVLAARTATTKLDLAQFERRPGEILLRCDVLDRSLINVSTARLVTAREVELVYEDGAWRVAGIDPSFRVRLWRLL